MHPLNDALPVPYVAVQVTRGAQVAHLHTYVLPRCRIRSIAGLLFPILVSLWNDLANPVFEGVGLAGFKSWVNAFLFA